MHVVKLEVPFGWGGGQAIKVPSCLLLQTVLTSEDWAEVYTPQLGSMREFALSLPGFQCTEGDWVYQEPPQPITQGE